MIVTVHQPNFLPYLGYFDKIYQADVFVIMDNFQFTKRSYINRNRIKTPEGWMWLTVPVTLDGLPPINEVEIASQKFKSTHLKTLQHMYGNSDFSDKYQEWIATTYETDWSMIADLNIKLLLDVIDFLDIGTEIAYTSDIEIRSEDTTGKIIEICESVDGTMYLSGQTGKDYLNKEMFAEVSMDLSFHSFDAFEYEQQFDGFIPNLSILDYLMNVGNKMWEVQGA